MTPPQLPFLTKRSEAGRLQTETDGFINAYGRKALGICRLPEGATPAYLFIHSCLYEAWKKHHDLVEALQINNLPLAALEEMVADLCGRTVIVRSSGTSESISDRGRFLSCPANLRETDDLARAIEAIFVHFEAHRTSGSMALVIQHRVELRLDGHLSNERRVADKPYRWRMEIVSSGASFTISAKQAADLGEPYEARASTGRDLRRTLASVAKWAWRKANTYGIDRSALEWGWDGDRVWIFQWDAIQDNDDKGIDPRQLTFSNPKRPQADDGEWFRLYVVGSRTPWPKLQKLATFAFGKQVQHRLFHASADRLALILNGAGGISALAREIDALTAGQAVVRTDYVCGGMDLPKTDTVDGKNAVDFIRCVIADLKASEQDLRDHAFLLHQYVESTSSAWTYHRINTDLVYVDALWGLADGMQFLDCDTYVFSTSLDREISSTIRYKAKILQQQTDGGWTYSDVRADLARTRALDRSTVSQIARQTESISVQTASGAQIMWFCGLSPDLGLGNSIPWYMTDTEQDISERKALTLNGFRVCSTSDLISIPNDTRNLKIILDPDPDHIRSEFFLHEVAARCKALSIPIEMRGSVLAHAYHQLRSLGVDVYSANPTKKIVEIRQRKAFDKLVRDAIPDRINQNGEQAVIYHLDPSARRRAIASKMVEEAEELLRADSLGSVIEEIADLLELVRALASDAGVLFEEVDEIAAAKFKKRGGFADGVILSETATRINSDPEHPLLPGIRTRDLSKISRTNPAFRHGGRPSDKARVSISDILAVDRPVILEFSASGALVTIEIKLTGGHVEIKLRNIVEHNRDKLL